MQEAVSAGAHQPPDVIPVQWSLSVVTIVWVLIHALEKAASQVIRHLDTSPGHLGDNVSDDAQGDRHIAALIMRSWTHAQLSAPGHWSVETETLVE